MSSGPPRRNSSSIDRLLGPSSPLAATKLAYRPTHRVTPPRSVDVPVSRIELAQVKNSTNNPLRTYSAPQVLPQPSRHTPNSTPSSLPPPPAGLPPRPNFLPAPPVEHFGGIKRAGGPNEGPYQPQRKRRRSIEDVLAVASHYNARPNVGREARRDSPIIGLKNFNNWVKSVLIAKFGRRETDRTPKVKVLDLGCGKGGDLQKWARAGTDEFIGIDLAAVSVEQARSRWEQMRGQKFQADFFALDCFTTSIADVFEPAHVERLFDVVSLQFCMHYAFESEEKVRTMLDNVTKFLRPGGTFMGTIPDAYNLLERLAQLPKDEPLVFGNEVYRVKFDEQDPTPRYGHRYTFFLQDAVEEVPEYVVYWDEFVQLASEYGLRLQFHADFQRIFAEEKTDPHFADLLTRMKVVDAAGESDMTMDQWEATNLYAGFAFVKDEGFEPALAYD